MKTFKIAKKTNEVISTAPLYFTEAGTSGNDLYIVVSKENGSDLNEGGKLIFEKTASGNSGEMLKVYEENAEIKKIVPVEDKLYVYFEYIYIIPLTLASYRKIETPQDEGYQYKLYFTSDHHMLPCDLDDVSEGYKIYIKRGGDIVEFSDLAFCFPGELVKGKDKEPDGSCCNEPEVKFNFETMERNSILAKTKAEGFDPAPGDEVLFATNPFFHIDTGGTMNLYDFPPGEAVSILKYTDFFGLGAVLEQNYDAKKMFQEYQVNELFVDKIKESIIPDIIDLEKIKYAPAFVEENASGEETVSLATGLTFNLHFRTRVSALTGSETDKYYFDDVWHIDNDAKTWNGNGVEQDTTKKRDELYSDSGFVNSSNLIGYLGFTDDDIYNQKNKVKQTFLRLLFYDSKDPLTQNLLYYSTIFLDSGDLFGKYVKRKAWLEDVWEERPDVGVYYNPETYPVVWSSADTTDPCSAVTGQLMVNDEYDMTRSGEGFNIYLFRQDAPPENSLKDIYMKIEFNHAGYGRTVPFIRWPKGEDGKPKRLTVSDYIKEALYIPMKIRLTDRGYVYDFTETVNVTSDSDRCNGIIWENERLVFNLFEPMIEPE